MKSNTSHRTGAVGINHCAKIFFKMKFIFILFINNTNNSNITYTNKVSGHNTKLYYITFPFFKNSNPVQILYY